VNATRLLAAVLFLLPAAALADHHEGGHAAEVHEAAGEHAAPAADGQDQAAPAADGHDHAAPASDAHGHGAEAGPNAGPIPVEEVGGHEERGGSSHGEVLDTHAPAPRPDVKPSDVGLTMLLVLLAIGGLVALAQAVRDQMA